MSDYEASVEEVVVWGTPLPPHGTAGGGGGSTNWGDPVIARAASDLEATQNTYPVSCAQLETMTNRIDQNFTGAQEGGNHSTAYTIPGPVGDNSGVTIGLGVDLGQRNIGDLNRLGLHPNLINRLAPYLGLRGDAARSFLVQNPLTLGPVLLRQLNTNIHLELYNGLYQGYDNRSNFDFFRLPASAQTVLASVAIQYGFNLHEAAPVFFSAMTEGRCQDAVNELENFGDTTTERRLAEAALLQAAIDSGELPEQC